MTPVLINSCNVMDFGFDPFDSKRLAVACDDGRVRVWSVPEGGLLQQTNEPQFSFAAHADKIQARVPQLTLSIYHRFRTYHEIPFGQVLRKLGELIVRQLG